MKYLLTLLFVVAQASPGFGQDPLDHPLALPYGARGFFTNPAAASMGGASHLAFRLEADATQLAQAKLEGWELGALFAVGMPGLPWMAYASEMDENQIIHALSYAASFGRFFSLGYTYSWLNADFFKPIHHISAAAFLGPWVSLGATANVGIPGWQLRSGVALRPLAAFDFGHRLAVYADAETTPAQAFRVTAAGLVWEAWPGLDIQAGVGLGQTPVLGLSLVARLGNVEQGAGFSTGWDGEPSVASLWTGFSLLAPKTSLGERPLLIDYTKASNLRDSPRDPSFFGMDIFGTQTPSTPLLEIIQDIRSAARNPRVQALVFRNQDFIGSLPQLRDVRAALMEAKASGKKIYFYSDYMTPSAYFVASGIADRIVVHPLGGIHLTNLGGRGLYWGEFLRQWGIEFLSFQSHGEKTFGNPLTQGQPTQEEILQYERFYASFREEILSVLELRAKTKGAVASEWLDQGPYWSIGHDLVGLGLVDALEYREEFDLWLEEYHPGAYTQENLAKTQPIAWGEVPAPRIAIVYAEGTIVEGPGGPGFIGHETFVPAIRRVMEDASISGVILRVNSGGGSVLASDAIARVMVEMKNKFPTKPLYVSMGGVAASGGYYISSPADLIFASEDTLTGSIGVVGLHWHVESLLKTQNIGTAVFGTGPNADFGSNLRRPTEDEIAYIKRIIDNFYRQFVNFVSVERAMDPSKVDEAGRGRVWTGRQALELGLVDRIGGLEDTIRAMESELGTDTARLVEVVPMPVMGFSLRDFLGDTDFVPVPGLEGVMDEWRKIKALTASRYLFWEPLTLGWGRLELRP